jgi:hypothetical protein
MMEKYGKGGEENVWRGRRSACREEFRLNYFGYLSLLEGMRPGPAGLSLQ